MKSVKKSAAQEKSKNENTTTPSIQNFFKSAPKPFHIGTSDTLKDATKAVYVEALKRKLQGKRFSNLK